MAPGPGRRDGVPFRLFESQGTTSRCRCFLSMAPGLKHSGKGAVRVRGVDHQAGGVCRGYRRSRLLEPPQKRLGVAGKTDALALNGRAGVDPR